MSQFGEDYFQRGPETGLSNFTDYRWMPDQTISWASHLKRYLGIRDMESVLDVGAARGFYCQALRMLGVQAYGYDVSEWAVANCHPEMKPYMSNHLNGQEYDFIYSKDTFEHIPPAELQLLVLRLIRQTRRKLFVIVPLAVITGGKYAHPKEENDVTHINRWTLPDWLLFFKDCSASVIVNGSYCYPGLKPGTYECERGYGFFTIEKI